MRLAAVLLLLPFAACAIEPELGARPSLAQSLQRPLQFDLSPGSLAARSSRIAALWDELQDEPGRLSRLTAAPAWIGDRAARRSTALPAAAARLVSGEAARPPAAVTRLEQLGAHLAAPEGDLASHQAAAAHLLGVARPPLGEIDDVRHRTDPDDDRAERSLWERLVRRLRL